MAARTAEEELEAAEGQVVEGEVEAVRRAVAPVVIVV